MNRFLALVGALVLACLSVSSACSAAPAEWVNFTLQQRGGGDQRIQANFRDTGSAADKTNWSSGFHSAELVGLDLAGFRADGTRPLRFALIREAGRLDCSGQGGDSYAVGNCSFTPDPAFAQQLVSRGIARPTNEQAFALMAVNARRELIDAIAAVRYPTPSIDDLVALSALGVDRGYIEGLALAGYRPSAIHSLIEFKALEITPEWIGGLARIGCGNVPAHELVQLKALNITPEFIAGYDRIGYRHLPVGTLVQLKALDITPDFVRWAAAGSSIMPPINELVDMKIFGRRH